MLEVEAPPDIKVIERPNGYAKDRPYEVDRYVQDTKERRLLSHWVIGVVSVWLGLVMLVLMLNGKCGITLSDTVLCVLLGTTTLNILGLAYIVLKGLFPESK